MALWSRIAAALVALALVALALAGLAAPARAAPGDKPPVGRVLTPRGPVCTGVLIGRHAVLTAAHCVANRSQSGYFSADLIHFALYPEDGDQLYAKSVEMHVSPDYTLPVSTERENLEQDWAVLILDTPLGDAVAPAPVLTRDMAARPSDYTLTVVAFGRARTLRPSIDMKTCKVLDTQDKLLTHDCLVEPGSSGSVLLGARGGRYHALAVNVAVRRGTNERTTATLLPREVLDLADRVPAPATRFRSPFERQGTASWNRPKP